MSRVTIGRPTLVFVILVASLIGINRRVAADDSGVYVMNVDGGGERKVIAVERAVSHRSPRWSHDGKRLAFEAVDGRTVRKSYVVNLDGTELKEVAELGSPDWSPSDLLLALEDEANGGWVFVQNLNGRERTQLVQGAWPRWSPDGKRIAFCDGTLLKIFDLVQGSEKRICQGTFVQRPGSFDWSRDGQRIALFTRTVRDGPRELYIINADGTRKDLKPRYSRAGMVGGHVTWSPDDKQLVFTIDSMINMLDVEGTAEPRLVPNQSDSNRDPALSPDGKWIAFVRRPRSAF